MKGFIVVILAAFAVAILAKEDEAPRCFCPRLYAPVCASNGRTYPNKCEFECVQKVERSLRILRTGTCEEELSNDIESFDLYE